MSNLCLNQFELSQGMRPDGTYTFNHDSNQYVAVDFEMTSQVDDFNDAYEIWCKAWQYRENEVNAMQQQLIVVEDEKKALIKRIDGANDVYNVIKRDWSFVCHGTFGSLIRFMMDGLNPITRTDFIVGDYVFMKDPHYREMWIVTNILKDGRIELKTACHGFPVPAHCWGMYYGKADGIRHARPQEKLNMRRDD